MMTKRKRNQDVEVNWLEYYQSIAEVCPWSLGYYESGEIDHTDISATVGRMPLDGLTARVYYSKDWTASQLLSMADAYNDLYPEEEWLYSHPSYKGYSTPVPALIQQDRAILEEARKKKRK
tara:strand:+ start:960 stop:1322 length:363 start_codon:yes stop_codon:yes gene_type:complete